MPKTEITSTELVRPGKYDEHGNQAEEVRP